MNNEPVAYVNSMCNDCIDWKIDPMGIDGQPLYTTPQDQADRIAELEEEILDLKGIIDIMENGCP